jgi:hypothetical protein
VHPKRKPIGWRQWDHLRENKRRAEVEARRRAEVADLYE